jgi:hypothetical protein
MPEGTKMNVNIFFASCSSTPSRHDLPKHIKWEKYQDLEVPGLDHVDIEEFKKHCSICSFK